jgi:hypothetical protein
MKADTLTAALALPRGQTDVAAGLTVALNEVSFHVATDHPRAGTGLVMRSALRPHSFGHRTNDENRGHRECRRVRVHTSFVRPATRCESASHVGLRIAVNDDGQCWRRGLGEGCFFADDSDRERRNRGHECNGSPAIV